MTQKNARAAATGAHDAARRDFLKTAGVATGGFVLGVALPLAGRGALAAKATGAPATLNAFVEVGADGVVTLYMAKTEMGQGVYTGLAQVLAEELEVDVASVRIATAPATPEYAKAYQGLHFTGGSNSVMTSFDLLRQAGAAAREMLVAAAAKQLQAPATALRAENGHVVHAASGRKLAYGALAAEAAKLAPPEKVALKPREQWKVIGRSVPRVDSRAKSDGTAPFGLDVRVPGMHYAMIARAPVFGAKVESFDATAAKAIPGVVKIVQVSQGVAVVAKHTWAARRGRDALVVKWSAGDAAGFSTAALDRRYAELARTPGVVAHASGDVAKVEGAVKTLEAEYAAPYLSHAPLEPLNCTVAFGPDGVDIWSGTQMQSPDHYAAASTSGLPPEKVRLHTVTYLGGAFGRRANPVSDFLVEAIEVAKASGLPVQTVRTREEDMQGGWYRPQGAARLTAALGADGKPLAWTHTAVVQPILKGTIFEAYGVDKASGLDATTFEGAKELPYAIPNVRVDVHEQRGPVPVLWWRSVGHTHSAFTIESFVDECAHAAGQDPLAYRLALLEKHPRQAGVLKLAAEKAGWGTPLPAGRARGIAAHHSFGSWSASVVEVSLDGGKPRVHRVVSAIDCGTAVNPRLVEHQLESAVTLGLSAALYEEITLENGRVQQTNFDTYTPLRLSEMPVVDAYVVPSTEPPTGVGEPGLPPVAPALANALYALTGVRARRLPLKHTDFTRKA